MGGTRSWLSPEGGEAEERAAVLEGLKLKEQIHVMQRMAQDSQGEIDRERVRLAKLAKHRSTGIA